MLKNQKEGGIFMFSSLQLLRGFFRPDIGDVGEILVKINYLFWGVIFLNKNPLYSRNQKTLKNTLTLQRL